MFSGPSLRTGLLDLAAGIGIAGPALMALYSAPVRHPGVSALIAGLLAAAVVTWVMWRRSAQRSRIAAVAFVAIATVTMALGNGALYYGIIWTACLVLGVTFSAGIVLWAYAAGLVTLVVALHLSTGSPPQIIFIEAIGAALLAGIAAAVAVVLRDSLRVSDSLQDALVRLDAANEELQRRLQADRDLVLAQERERTARELHDDLGHRLTAIGLSLDYVSRVDDPDAARAEVIRARSVVGDSLAAMRRLVRAMHPVELSALGDAEAFGAVAEAFRGTGIDITVTIEGEDVPLPHEQSLLLLRFVQEGLTNVVRHSRATAVRLHVVVAPDGVDAVIADDGGTGSVGATAADGFGLRSLRSRAEALGGRLPAEPTLDGFRLAVALPSEAAAVALSASGGTA